MVLQTSNNSALILNIFRTSKGDVERGTVRSSASVWGLRIRKAQNAGEKSYSDQLILIILSQNSFTLLPFLDEFNLLS